VRRFCFAIAEPLNERELKWVIGRTQFFIGSRMHACIAALSQCVPAVGLAYSAKFLGVFESAGVGRTIVDLRKCDAAEVVASVARAWMQRTELRGELQERVASLQSMVPETFRRLIENAAGAR
jgi:colanic acid/amylovoran biosynthesis protein